jgi:hypothetical protein
LVLKLTVNKDAHLKVFVRGGGWLLRNHYYYLSMGRSVERPINLGGIIAGSGGPTWTIRRVLRIHTHVFFLHGTPHRAGSIALTEIEQIPVLVSTTKVLLQWRWSWWLVLSSSSSSRIVRSTWTVSSKVSIVVVVVAVIETTFPAAVHASTSFFFFFYIFIPWHYQGSTQPGIATKSNPPQGTCRPWYEKRTRQQ